jgi:hypothetical protein
MPNAASLANLRIKPFRPAQSGNTRGRPRKYHEALHLAGAATPEAVRLLLKCMRDEEAPWPARLAAAVHLLDRGWGKPRDLQLDGEGGALLRIEFVDTDDATTITIQRPAPETSINGEVRDDDDTLRLSFESDL